MRTTTVQDVMTRSVVTVREDAGFKDLVTTMHRHGVSGVPVVDEGERLVGIVTQADLLIAEDEARNPRAPAPLVEWFIHPDTLSEIEGRGDDVSARDLMTREVVTIGPDAPVHHAIRRMLESEVKRLPVVDADGRVVGIVSRRDLLRPFLRGDETIRLEIADDVIRRTMWMDPATIDVEVARGVVTLQGTVDRRSDKEILAAMVRRVGGVVGVNDELGYRTDDRGLAAPPPPSELGWGENWVRAR